MQQTWDRGKESEREERREAHGSVSNHTGFDSSLIKNDYGQKSPPPHSFFFFFFFKVFLAEYQGNLFLLWRKSTRRRLAGLLACQPMQQI